MKNITKNWFFRASVLLVIALIVLSYMYNDKIVTGFVIVGVAITLALMYMFLFPPKQQKQTASPKTPWLTLEAISSLDMDQKLIYKSGDFDTEVKAVVMIVHVYPSAIMVRVKEILKKGSAVNLVVGYELLAYERELTFPESEEEKNPETTIN